MEYFIMNYGNQVILMVLCIVFGMIGRLARVCADRFLTDDVKRGVAEAAVKFAEQTCTELHGREKLTRALRAAEVLLIRKGIPFDAREMEILIESALAEFNRAFAA